MQFASECTFLSPVLHEDKVRVVGVHGVEELGRLYEFQITFDYLDQPLTEEHLAEMLLGTCSLTFGGGVPIHGIAREVYIQEAVHGRSSTYEVVLVPTAFLLLSTRISRIYQHMSVKDMTSQMLTRYGLASYLDMRVKSSSPRDFCLQYQETDWHYLERWWQHEGYYYWFEHSEDGEKLVVADANSETTPIAGDTKVSYREAAGFARDEESVTEWRSIMRRIPAQVVLKDYNEQKPLLPIVGHADVDKKHGFGVFVEYGDNFESPALGNALAKKRAQRFSTERLTLLGLTDSNRFHVGHWFELQDHFDHVQNRKYLITSIAHRYGEMGGGDGERAGKSYRASFEAIPFATEFRPERRTEWPTIHGLIHGHIDSDTSGKFSTLDKQGRYRVRFPFDSTGSTGEQSSVWLRLVQSYSGSGYGSHFPLHKGTEVVVGFFDGDPDRPVIVGTLPNALTPGLSAEANATQSGHRTHSGIELIMDDSVSRG
jgi:type VI secretion system secreted protein VgrG